MSEQKFRLVTRSDFDGLVCAVLLRELGMLDGITFVHPKDMQDGKVEIGPTDITTNLPTGQRPIWFLTITFPKPCATAARARPITSLTRLPLLPHGWCTGTTAARNASRTYLKK